ncbi:hypothetical protein [Thalassotalea sp. ND16A]|uniref:hypothetical protein n=1 Tax=Thalassotalea sp. ND16A TaxID=1535422 RepID=UPI00051A51BC|nr:hypothetical protein [Thalassotalea sp. ND16A]KGJ99891.1 hypothetical protein ND16A_3679 [Thalassotalea sp. ND16A]
MGRNRKPENRDLPKGLYANKDSGSATGYYHYFNNPFFGVEGVANHNDPVLKLGPCRATAIATAKKLAQAFEAFQKNQPILIKNKMVVNSRKANKFGFSKPKFIKVNGDKIQSVSPLVDHALARLEEDYHTNSNVVISYNEYKNKKSYLNRIKARWDNLPVDFINAANMQVHIDEYVQEGKINTAKKFISRYSELLSYGIRYGLIDFEKNPAEDLKVPKTKVKRSRLSAATALEVTQSPELSYLPNKFSVELGLITSMRPQDFALTRKSKGEDWGSRIQNFIENRNTVDELADKNFEEYSNVAPYPYIDDTENCIVYFCQKTLEICAIDLDMHNKTLDKSLKTLINEIQVSCCDANSPFLIHHTVKNGKVTKGAPINPRTLSKRFTAAIKELNKNWLNGSNPTLYELRSLGIRNESSANIVATKLKQQTPKPPSKNEGNETTPLVSTIEEKVMVAVKVKTPEKLGGHSAKSKMRSDVYSKARDLAYQQLSGFT